MAQIAISITKRIAFRLGTQEFANTYHYGSAGALPSVAAAEALIDEIVVEEKKFHSTNVSFILGRCWSSGGSIASNAMITEKALTGTGASAPLTAVDPERAVLVQWPAGLDSRGRKVYLRKWFHCNGSFGSVAMSNSHLTQQIAFSTADRATIVGYADALSRIGTPEAWGLVAESGRTRDGGIMSADPPICHPFLEHHQLGDQWRG